jgi:hypothetical protein
MSVIDTEPRLRRDRIGQNTRVAAACAPAAGVVIGTLVGFDLETRQPLVIYPGQPGESALPARAVLDLQGGHVGGDVVLMFDGCDPRRPIVMGCVRPSAGWPATDVSSPVEVDVDGQRLVVSAVEQLVLRCGKASITLTRAGKVLIDGTFVLSRSSGVNRIKGGSVQIN